MVNIAQSPDGVPRRLHQPNVQRMRGMVRQDKSANSRARVASPQPAPPKKVSRPLLLETNIFRSQKKNNSNVKLVHLTVWVHPLVKAELQRTAERERLSVSKVGSAGLEEWVRQQLHLQHTVLIQPIIETTIRNELRRYFSRMILFLARITMTLDVEKGLVKWLARRIAGVTKEQVDAIEVRSRTDARVNLVKRTPQLEKITEELEKTLMEGIV